MSTMYYTHPEKKAIGQTHAKPRGQGYHFTWTMFPMEFANHVWGKTHERDCIQDEHSNLMSFFEFQDIVVGATSQSFTEGIE